MTLKYHQALFDMIGIKPMVEPERLDKIKAIQNAYGILLPEGVKEWLLIANMTTVLTLHSSFTWIEDINSFGHLSHIEGLSKRNNQLLAERKIVPILSERNGDWTWFLSLQDTGHDPKIMLNSSEFKDSLLSHPHRFSKQLFVNVWDYRVMHTTTEGFYLKANTPPILPDTLELFRRNCNEIVTTFILLTNETTYRFQKKDYFILLKDNGEQTTWYLYAKHQGALQKMLDIALQVNGLKQALHPVETGTDEWERKLNQQLITSILGTF